MKSLSGPTATEHKETICNIFICYELLSSWIFIWKIEPHSGFLSRVGHWLYNFVWSWNFLACSFHPAKLEGLRDIPEAVKHFRISNFPFYIEPSFKKSATLLSLPLQNTDVISAGNSPVLSSALDLWHQLNPCQKTFSGHALCLLFQLGRLRPKLVSDFQLQKLLDWALVLRGYFSLFTPEGSSQNLEDTEACRQSSCYSDRGVIPFNMLP